ncbi:hypothetical protein BZA70DRAFT_280483 [Myxozyma melibiosi]|uniref:NADH-ubiquinone oxidoreductase subunit B14.7 n=1 Tax=Myxozyma melibiosi TaxID=54550 RepID=A0ABR1F5E9_9ASCO
MSIVPKVVYPVHLYPTYEPRDAIATSAALAVPCLGAGLAMTAALERIQTPKAKMTESAIRIAKNTGYIASVAALYQFVEIASANLRETEDGWNKFYGGLAGGALIGLKKGTMTSTIWTSLVLGSALGLAGWAGGLFSAPLENGPAPEGSPYDQKKGDFFSIRYRAPLSETIDKLGEGRGIEYSKAGVSRE